MVVFRQSGCIREQVVVFCLSGCFRAKVVVCGQGDCIRQRWLYSDKMVVFGQQM